MSTRPYNHAKCELNFLHAETRKYKMRKNNQQTYAKIFELLIKMRSKKNMNNIIYWIYDNGGSTQDVYGQAFA